MKRNNKKAFTLAEVLITLGIIGVVAAMTIPTIMSNIQDQQFKTAYKKAYSSASQAWLTAQANEELTLCDSWYNAQCNKDNFNVFKQKMKVLKDCGNDTASCWDMTGEKSWPGNNYPTASALSFIDTSGVAWTQLRDAANTSPEVLVDTNGSKKPNQYGKDRAVFTLLYVNDPVNVPLIKPVPQIQLMRDCTGTVPADYPGWTVAQQTYRCPSYATHPCYYTSWITGEK